MRVWVPKITVTNITKLKRLDSDLRLSVKSAIACAVLHNVCIKMGDNWDDNGNPDVNCSEHINNEHVLWDGEEIRDILKESL